MAASARSGVCLRSVGGTMKLPQLRGRRDGHKSDQDTASEMGVPLVVDLDGTLLRTDLLVESAFLHFFVRIHLRFGNQFRGW